MHAGENPPANPGRHQCDGWDITKDTGEAIGGPLLVAGSILADIAASPLGPAERAMAIGGVLTGGATTIDGFKSVGGVRIMHIHPLVFVIVGGILGAA